MTGSSQCVAKKGTNHCKDQISVGLFPSCKYITVHNLSLNCIGFGDIKLHI